MKRLFYFALISLMMGTTAVFGQVVTPEEEESTVTYPVTDTNPQAEAPQLEEQRNYPVTDTSFQEEAPELNTGVLNEERLGANIVDDDALVTDVEFSFYMDNYGYAFNNGDLRATDNSSYLTVDYTDDKLFVMLTEIGGEVTATIMDVFEIDIALYRPGYWGNDSLSYGGSDNTIFARELNMKIDLWKALFDGDKYNLGLTIGRQGYSIVDDDDHSDYVLSDMMDMLFVNFEMPDNGIGVDAFFDFMSMNSPVDSVYSLKTGQDYTVDNFDGDVNIYRIGLLPYYKLEMENSFISLLDAQAYFLFSRIGATGKGEYDQGGYEMSGIGYDGNFADNDWVAVMGFDAYADIDLLTANLAFAYSIGKDRKAVDVPDVDISGMLINLSVLGDLGIAGLDWLTYGLEGLFVSGASTDEYGNYLNYGFVSMKGNKVGGFLFERYYGNYPSAVVNSTGIDYDPFSTSRRAGTHAASLQIGIDNLDVLSTGKVDTGLNALAEAWAYFDSSATSINTNLSLPASTYDQIRLGRFMGIEIDGDVSYAFNEGVFEVGLQGGLFISYDYFLHPVSLKESPYGNDLFWGLKFYSSLEF